jgi:FixJ family two-component response regulator
MQRSALEGGDEIGALAEGLSNPQIGERLYVSPRTVQTHVAHVLTKLGVVSRAQLAAEAARRRRRNSVIRRMSHPAAFGRVVTTANEGGTR